MIRHVWSVLCSLSIIDQGSNNLSLINVVEQLNIEIAEMDNVPDARIPTIPIGLEVVTLWEREQSDQSVRGRARVVFVSPSGHIFDNGAEYDIDLNSYSRFRSRGRYTSLPIRENGKHNFIIQLKHEGETEWKDVAQVPIEIASNISS